MSLHVWEELEQGSEEWFAARRGIVTASVVGKLISTGPPDPITIACPKCDAPQHSPCVSVARKEPTPIKVPHDVRAFRAAELPPVYGAADNETSRGLVAALAAERITGWTEPSYMNDDMMRGVLHEPIARDRYAEHNGVDVEQVGFMARDDWGFRLGASPDGLIGTDGGLEVKCPRAKTHIRTVIADEVPAQYMAQVQACLLVSGREWWDFVSFCAGLPMWTKRVYPDAEYQAAIVAAVAAFEQATERMTSDYFARADGLPATEQINDDLGLVF